MNIPQSDPLALLATGKVLLAGLGANANHMFISKAALYDPSTNKWTLTGSMRIMRRGHTLTRLVNGKMLAAAARDLSATTPPIAPSSIRRSATGDIAAFGLAFDGANIWVANAFSDSVSKM